LAFKLREEKKDREVFYVKNSESLHELDLFRFEEDITKLKVLGKTVIIIVDEAHTCPTASMWTNLLKTCHSNLIVIGFGVSGVSEYFEVQHEPPAICYSAGNNTDMLEVVTYWAKEVPTIERETIADICDHVCLHTNGQAFAFLSIVELLMTQYAGSSDAKDLKGDKFFNGCIRYMASESFYNQPEVRNLIVRCFRNKVRTQYPDFLNMLMPRAVDGRSVIECQHSSRLKLEDLGFLSATSKINFSALLLNVFFMSWVGTRPFRLLTASRRSSSS